MGIGLTTICLNSRVFLPLNSTETGRTRQDYPGRSCNVRCRNWRCGSVWMDPSTSCRHRNCSFVHVFASASCSSCNTKSTKCYQYRLVTYALSRPTPTVQLQAPRSKKNSLTFAITLRRAQQEGCPHQRTTLQIILRRLY